MMNHQKKKFYRCAVCKARLASMPLLKQHLQHHIDCEKFHRNVLKIKKVPEAPKFDDEIIVIDSD